MKIKTLITTLALVAITCPLLAEAQVSSNFWKYLNYVLSPQVVNLNKVDLLATTTAPKIGVATSSPFATLSVGATLGTPPFIIASSSAGQPATIYVDGNTGNVGFGTSTPPSRLTFASVGSGSLQMGAMNDLGANYTALSLNGFNLSSTTYNFASSPTDQNRSLFINVPLDGNFRFRQNNGESGLTRQDMMTILANGNIGIGTSTPTNFLSLASTTDASSTVPIASCTIRSITLGQRPYCDIRFEAPINTSNLPFHSGDVRSGFYKDGASYLNSFVALMPATGDQSSIYGVFVNGNGQVGIGTSTPARPLTVYRAGERGGLLLVDGAGTPVDTTTQGGTYLASQAGLFTISGMNSVGAGTSPYFGIDQTFSGGAVAVGTSSNLTANFQATTQSNNASTSIIFGKSGQNKGACVTWFDAAGSPVYIYIKVGATAFTFQNGGTPPSGCKN